MAWVLWTPPPRRVTVLCLFLSSPSLGDPKVNPHALRVNHGCPGIGSLFPLNSKVHSFVFIYALGRADFLSVVMQ